MFIIKCILLISIVTFAFYSSRYMLGLGLLFFVALLEVSSREPLNALFLVSCEVIATIFIVQETKVEKEKSFFIKYNPLAKDNVIPKKIQGIILLVFTIASIIRIIDLLLR